MKKYYFKSKWFCNFQGYLTLEPFGIIKPQENQVKVWANCYTLTDFYEFKRSHPDNVLIDLRLYDLIPEETDDSSPKFKLHSIIT